MDSRILDGHLPSISFRMGQEYNAAGRMSPDFHANLAGPGRVAARYGGRLMDAGTALAVSLAHARLRRPK